MQEYVIQLNFVDRPGLGLEIFQITEKNNIDKIAMEVLPKRGMMIKIRSDSDDQLQQLIKQLQTVEGIESVSLRDQMHYEEREHELRTLLNSVSEGILAVDKDGRISHINQVACKIFHSTPNEAIGKKAEEFLDANPPILETLRSGQTYHLQERRITKAGRTIHFLTSGVPVINDKGQIIGAVSTIKDFRQVEEIMSKVDKSRGLTTFDDIVYHSEKMSRLIGQARTVAKGSSTILIRGDSGTGKELFATAIHMEGPKPKAPFIAINCSALPDSLLESELFGYEEGAFTGASKGGKKGLFEQANGGTLFLDEIGEISPQVQVRLLRVLQEGTLRRVGGSTEIRVDVRIIAATHRNLEEMIRQGDFREDLYYRLNVIPINIPPLRERVEDIPLIAQNLIRKICIKLNKPEVRLARESVQLLMTYNWPGNVRELENALERLINMVDTVEIQPCHLLQWIDIGAAKRDFKGANQPQGSMLQIPIPDHAHWPPLKDIVAEVEKEVLRKVLVKYPSSRLAGQALGVSNTTILNKIKTYKLGSIE
jgi:transcriptional regulator of aroF, aroG, tyrA and aromatic amino acid transport